MISASRGQASIEFTLVMGIALLMLLSLLVIGSWQLRETADDAERDRMEDVARSIQQELLTATAVTDGYARVFALPPKLYTRPYTITLQNVTGGGSVVTLITTRNRFSVATPRCEGSLHPGANTVHKLNNTLRCNP